MNGTATLAKVENPALSETGPDFLFIGELARDTGVDPKTIRFYEREGLLHPPRHGKFRTYRAADVQRLRDVIAMRRMGVGLAQIRTLLNSAGGLASAGDALEALLSSHLDVLRERQSELARQMEATLSSLEKFKGLVQQG